jgi:F0F1-type ATP synthase membrane subunit b/b'
MTVDELRAEIKDEFERTRGEMTGEFENVRAEMKHEFDNVRTEMKGEFKNVRAEMKGEFENVRTEMKGEFENVRAEITNLRAEFKEDLRAAIEAEGETTRRHFDIMVEKISDSVRIVAEGTAHNTSRIDRHEKRITNLEKSRRS